MMLILFIIGFLRLLRISPCGMNFMIQVLWRWGGEHLEAFRILSPKIQ